MEISPRTGTLSLGCSRLPFDERPQFLKLFLVMEIASEKIRKLSNGGPDLFP
jgi:hypothetical protein